MLCTAERQKEKDILTLFMPCWQFACFTSCSFPFHFFQSYVHNDIRDNTRPSRGSILSSIYYYNSRLSWPSLTFNIQGVPKVDLRKYRLKKSPIRRAHDKQKETKCSWNLSAIVHRGREIRIFDFSLKLSYFIHFRNSTTSGTPCDEASLPFTRMLGNYLVNHYIFTFLISFCTFFFLSLFPNQLNSTLQFLGRNSSRSLKSKCMDKGPQGPAIIALF